MSRGRRIHIIRNPDYVPVDDFRPAFLDEIDIQAGNDDTAVATRRILGGESIASGETLLMVAGNAEPEKSIAQITEQMGFTTKLRLVTRDTMFTRFCSVPDAEVQVCPSVGWSKDFNDPQTMLDPTFNGNNIIPTQNSNWPELDVPEINDKIEAAKLLTDPAERAQAWSDVNHDIMAQAPSIPVHVGLPGRRRLADVRGVQSGYSTTWDWNFTSLR